MSRAQANAPNPPGGDRHPPKDTNMETNIPKIKPEWLVGITMTSEQKAKWLQALRSDRFKQGTGSLFHKGQYCCLGVAGEVCLGMSPDSMNGLSALYGEATQFLGCSTANSIQGALMMMNDGDGPRCREHSFAEIADFIEQHIPACDEARS